MYVKYYGHACFSVCDKDKKVVIDPFGDIGYKQPSMQTDFCLCTHSHYDHHSTDCVAFKHLIEGDNKGVDKWLTVIPSYHDEVMGKKRGENSIYKLICDGIAVCHMGDLGMPFNAQLVKSIGKVDVLMIPIGGNYTIDATNARAYVQAINPKIIIPMHYKTKRSDIDIDTKDEFLSYFNCVVKKPSEFEITSNDLCGEARVFDLDDKEF